MSPQIQPPSALSLTVQALPDASPEALGRVVDAQMAQPFDLATGPLVRATLLRLPTVVTAWPHWHALPREAQRLRRIPQVPKRPKMAG